MEIQLICENCNSIVELKPENMGQEAKLGNLEDKFYIQDVQLDYDQYVDEIEDVTATLDSIRIDCKNCNEYIVLREFNY